MAGHLLPAVGRDVEVATTIFWDDYHIGQVTCCRKSGEMPRWSGVRKRSRLIQLPRSSSSCTCQIWVDDGMSMGL